MIKKQRAGCHVRAIYVSELQDKGFGVYPWAAIIGSLVVPVCGLNLGSYNKVTPKRNY